MSTDPQGDANKEVTAILTRGLGWLRSHVVAAVGSLVVALAAVVWRSPHWFIGLVASTVMIIAVLYAVAYMRLHASALAGEKAALAEVDRLRMTNLMGERRFKMLEESLYHVLLAWMGDSSSAQALDRTLPHNTLVRHVVASLGRHENMPWNADRIRDALDVAEAERAQIEEVIGPERVQQTITLSVTTHGNRRVERAEPTDGDSMRRSGAAAAGPDER